ncbi:MAG: prephenate dehydrogenase/arogenate dehydrogenase family protein [Candidatus Limnocylindrales bacterium]
MKVAFLGFGLIGGSVARALRERGPDEGAVPTVITAWSPSGRGPSAAVLDGIVDVAATSPQAAIEAAELVVLAGPPGVCLDMLDDLAGAWRSALLPDAVITDVASTKAAIVLRATALGLRFVGGHPMAGRESSGYGAATSDLFIDRPWVIVPGADERAVARVEALATAVGAHLVRLSASAHDQAVAGISHLPLITSAALVEAVAGSRQAPREDWAEAQSVAASGWRDMTRLARGDIDMGAGIATTNAVALARRIRDLMAVLDGWAGELERPGGPDPDAIRGRFERARAVLEASER